MKKQDSIAYYACLECNKVSSAKPGPVTCGYCGHEYLKWLNYKE